MADPFSYASPSDDDISQDENIKLGLSGLLSPVDAQTIANPPPASAPKTGAGQTTPQTGTLATAPSQAQPRVSGPPMIPGIAAKPEDLAGGTVQSQVRLPSSGPVRGPQGGIVADMNGHTPAHPLSDLNPRRAALVAQLASARSGAAPTMPASLDSIPGFSSSAPSLPAYTAPQVSSPSRLGLNNPSRISPQSMQAAQINAGGPGNFPTLPSTSPTLPDTGSSVTPNIVAPKGTLEGDTAELNRLQDTGSGVSQIKRPWLRDLLTVGDDALRVAAPGVEPLVKGGQGYHDSLVNRDEGRIANDQSMAESRAKIDNYRAEQAQRQADAGKYSAQADADRPYAISSADAQSIGHPELQGSQMTPRQLTALQVQQGRNNATIQTHTGGQPHKVTAQDALLVNAKGLEGETISNDAWQRLLSGVQRNAQSGANNSANNAAHVQTTNMRDQTSTANNERTHAGRGAGANSGAPKPIPPSVRDRIESQKNTAINKARADFDSGASTQDDYLNAWQQAQDDYEGRISTQTGQSVPHTDIRANTDKNGNWIGPRQGSTQPPQAQQQPRNAPAFKSKTGDIVKLGDPVNVGGKKGTVAGFNPRTGKVQISWASGQ